MIFNNIAYFPDVREVLRENFPDVQEMPGEKGSRNGIRMLLWAPLGSFGGPLGRFPTSPGPKTPKTQLWPHWTR